MLTDNFAVQASWCLRRQFLGVSSRTHSSHRGDWTCRPSTWTSTFWRAYRGRTSTGKRFRTISALWNSSSRSSSRWWFKTTPATRLLRRWMWNCRGPLVLFDSMTFFSYTASDRLHHPSSVKQPTQSSVEHLPPKSQLHQHQPPSLRQQFPFPAIPLRLSRLSDVILAIPVVPVLFHQQSQPPIPRVGARFEPDRGVHGFGSCRNEACQRRISWSCNHSWEFEVEQPDKLLERFSFRCILPALVIRESLLCCQLVWLLIK